MAYQQGGIITANATPDYNTLRALVVEIFNDVHSNETALPGAAFGYGQAALPGNVAVGQSITAAQWNPLFNAIRKSATHQGTSVGDIPASVSAGDVITAYDGANGLVSRVNAIRTNKLTANAGQMTTTTNGNKLTSSRNTIWDNSVQHEFTVTFASYNAARYFFNSGGQIRMSAGRSGGTANSQNTAWTNMLSNMGTIVFGWDGTARTGSTGTATGVGFYDLTSTYQQIFQATPSGLSNDYYRIEARSSTAFGSTGTFRFRVTYHSDPASAIIDGTLNSFVDERRATGSLTIPAPTYNTTIPLGDTALSTHTVTVTNSSPSSIIEGQQACYLFTLNSPVVGANLSFQTALTGTEQALNGYPTTTLTIPVGSSSVSWCINTVDDASALADRQLCASAVPNARLTSSNASCITVLDNDSATSVHTITVTNSGPSTITEGQNACFLYTLNNAVVGEDLTFTTTLSGTEQALNGYPTTTLTIPVGSSSTTWCVTTINDSVPMASRQLCAGAVTNPRVSSANTSCITVQDNDAADSIHTITVTNSGPSTITEGQQACYLYTLDAPVVGTNLSFTTSLSGTEQTLHSYPTTTLTIPVGSSSTSWCVTTVDDGTLMGSRQLCASAVTNSRVTSASTICTTVQDNDSPGVSTHAATLSVAPGSDTAGASYTFTVTLDSNVTGGDLTVQVALSGSEQTLNGYSTPRSVTILTGQNQGTFTVNTNSRTTGGNLTLTGTIQSHARLTSTGSPASATVNQALLPIGSIVFADNWEATTLTPDGVDAAAGVHLVSNRSVAKAGTSSTSGNSQWLHNDYSPSDYELSFSGSVDDLAPVSLFTYVTPAGTNTMGSPSTWYNLGSGCSWTINVTDNGGMAQQNINYTIREISTGRTIGGTIAVIGGKGTPI